MISPRLEILIALKRDNNIEFRFDAEDLNKPEYLDAGLLWDWDIPFHYKRKNDEKEYQFIWQRWNWVDMYDETGKLWDQGDELIKNGNTELGEKYQSLHAQYSDEPTSEPYFDSSNTLLRELNRCIDKYEALRVL